MSRAKPPRVVAELGRPETPAETAARTAENSRLHRVRQTPNNLLLSLLATLGVVLVIVLIVPRAEAPANDPIDYAAVAEDVQQGVPVDLAIPQLPDGWRSNAAAYRSGADKVDYWYIGFLTPADEYIGMSQAFGANDTWIAKQLQNTIPSGAVTIDGVTWVVYDNRAQREEVGNAAYALVAQTAESTWLLSGTADPAEFETLASSLAPTILAEEPLQ